MKKTALLLSFLLVLSLFAVTGCGTNQTFAEKNYVYETGNFKNIILDVIDREIEINISDDDKICIGCYESEKEYYEISFAGDALSIKFAADKHWTDFFGTKPPDKYRKISIKLPNGLISDLSVKTTNEKISVHGVSVNNIMDLSSNGGNIALDKIGVGKSIRLTAKNGNISGTIADDWNTFAISCSIKKGECNLPLDKKDGNKSLIANCNNGNIDVSFTLQ